MLNVIKERITTFEYFCFDIGNYSFEVAVGRDIRYKTCCLYVLSYSSPLPFQGPKSNFHHLWKMSAGKHNVRANSEIGYSLRKVNTETIN